MAREAWILIPEGEAESVQVSGLRGRGLRLTSLILSGRIGDRTSSDMAHTGNHSNVCRHIVQRIPIFTSDAYRGRERYRVFIKYCVFSQEFSKVFHLSLATT